MQGRLTTKPVEEVISAIQALDLESVKARVMDPELGEGWSREYADSVESAYKNFLTMVVKHQDEAEEILPSKDVDEFWHTHILQTMKYADDCQAVFGAFIHHNPHIGKLTQADHERRAQHAEKTRLIYESEFGQGGAVGAWAGNSIKGSDADIHAKRAAVSSIAIRHENAAVSSIAIRQQYAAVSSIAIHAENAAVSSIAIRPEDSAVSSISIGAGRAAVSSIAIRADNAAVSSISIRPEHGAVSSIAIQAESAAVSSIAVRT